MIRHYASVVLPEGFKAQVVATSREAVMTYLDKLQNARVELVDRAGGVTCRHACSSRGRDSPTRRENPDSVDTHSQLEDSDPWTVAAIFSGDHNDPEEWWEWSDKPKQEERIKRFKRKVATGKN